LPRQMLASGQGEAFLTRGNFPEAIKIPLHSDLTRHTIFPLAIFSTKIATQTGTAAGPIYYSDVNISLLKNGSLVNRYPSISPPVVSDASYYGDYYVLMPWPWMLLHSPPYGYYLRRTSFGPVNYFTIVSYNSSGLTTRFISLWDVYSNEYTLTNQPVSPFAGNHINYYFTKPVIDFLNPGIFPYPPGGGAWNNGGFTPSIPLKGLTVDCPADTLLVECNTQVDNVYLFCFVLSTNL